MALPSFSPAELLELTTREARRRRGNSVFATRVQVKYGHAPSLAFMDLEDFYVDKALDKKYLDEEDGEDKRVLVQIMGDGDEFGEPTFYQDYTNILVDPTLFEVLAEVDRVFKHECKGPTISTSLPSAFIIDRYNEDGNDLYAWRIVYVFSDSSDVLSDVLDEAAIAAEMVKQDKELAAAPVFSVGDTVRLKGLISAPQYNGMKGIIVSEFNATTKRCGVRVTGTNVMAIQVTNLTLERRAKKSTIGDAHINRGGGSMKSQSRYDGVTQYKPPTGEGFHDLAHADSQMTFQVANIVTDIRKCKQGAVNVVLSSLRAGECNSLLLDLVDNGLIPVILGLLRQCEHKEFNEMVKKVKGNLQTPADLIVILVSYSSGEQFKMEIANGIQAIVRCLCDDSKRLFFMSNKYWNEAVPLFFDLVLNLLSSSDDSSSKVTASTVSNILLQNEGFLDSVVQTAFWSSYRPDLVKEYESHQLSVDIKSLETDVHKVIRNIVSIGLKRVMAQIPFPQDGLDIIMTIAKTPIVSRAYDPGCNVNYVVGMIRMLKNVKSNVGDRGDHFATLHMFMLNADCVDNGIIADVIDLGRNFTVNIDDAMSISELSYSMLVRKAQGNVYPIDKRFAFAIKSGLLDMCVEFIMRFACDLTIQSIACDAQRNQLMEALVCIAYFIHAVGFHRKTAKAIRDRQSQIIEALTRLSTKVQSKQTTQFVDLLSSIMDLNEGSCSRCNKPIEWRTALFCEGCRRVAYCGVKCQKMDWRHGSHSSDCSFLAHSADVMGLTTFDVKGSRNKSKLTGLRNNIVTSQKKLFLRHESSISSRLLNYSDRSDYIAVFDISNEGGFGGGGGGKGLGPSGGTFNPQGRDEVKLFVGNLSLYTDEEGVRNMFKAHGAVTDCFLPTDREHQPRGFAFVTMPAKDAEVACAKVNGLELDGRTLRVNVYMEAQPKGEYTLRHYSDQFTCVKQRKWFEGLKSSDKVICMFTSGVFNGEFDDEGAVNVISLFAVFPFSNHIQLGQHMEQELGLGGLCRWTVDSGEE